MTAGTVPIAVVGAHHRDDVCDLLDGLPAHLGLALVIACSDDRDLASLLRARTAARVIEAHADTPLEIDQIHVIPKNRAATYTHGMLQVAETASPATLDHLLRSVADGLGRRCAAVLLRGRGNEGMLGLKQIKQTGGFAIAERPDVAPETELLRAAIASGMVDVVGELAELRTQLPGIRRLFDAGSDTDDEPSGDSLRDVLALLRIRTGNDFSAYKRATLVRRIARRMLVCGTPTITGYHQFLRDHPAEIQPLLRDLLISVTSFFRDSAVFEHLELRVIPRLFAGKSARDQVRVWIAGCATGEEAYSIAMLLVEHASALVSPPSLKIFATDIDAAALAEARAGVYPDTIEVDVGATRLARFFVREDHQFRVTPELRELVLFSPHDLLRDPPFSRLDLVACRNLMIYLNRDAQTRALSVFHFGLRADGYLVLGSSESADQTALFEPLDGNARIYARRGVPGSLPLPQATRDVLGVPSRWPPLPLSGDRTSYPKGTCSLAYGELHHRLVELYAPPSVIVNAELEVVHVSEHAARFLRVAGGEPTRNLLALVLPELGLLLRTTIAAARASHTTEVRRARLRENRIVELRVTALELPGVAHGTLLVMFDERHDAEAPRVATAESLERVEPVVRELADELHQTREHLRDTIARYESTVGQLRASNEELQSANEELRAASEELEASKEELQAVNEELHTLNGELEVKVHEISHANGDLQNLMSSTDIGVLFLDRALNIKRFTPQIRQLINVIPGDVGRPLAHITHKLDTTELPALAAKVLQDLHTIEREVRSHAGQRYLVRLLPYRSIDDRIEGVVLTFVDVTDLRNAEAGLRDAEHRKDEFFATLSHELRNPLTPLKVALDVLKLAAEPTQRESAIAIMDRQLDHLIALVDELLDLSRIARGQIELESAPVDSVVVVESALETVRPLIQQHQLQLHVELPRSPARVLGDETRLVQILVTLLTNAAKYTPDGGRIELQVAVAGDRLVMRVHDSGVGIEPELLPRIFDLFVQSRDALGRSRTGYGTGLDRVRRLVQLHGGEVTAASAGANLGSEFVVTLPLMR